jgi:hypothetical protein
MRLSAMGGKRTFGQASEPTTLTWKLVANVRYGWIADISQLGTQWAFVEFTNPSLMHSMNDLGLVIIKALHLAFQALRLSSGIFPVLGKEDPSARFQVYHEGGVRPTCGLSGFENRPR